MSKIIPFEHHIEVEKLKMELPTYLAMAKECQIDHSDVQCFTQQVLAFWKTTPRKELNELRKAARIVFAMTPNSAACERVFALLKNMYGDEKDNVLADHIQASLMLRYNGRCPFE